MKLRGSFVGPGDDRDPDARPKTLQERTGGVTRDDEELGSCYLKATRHLDEPRSRVLALSEDEGCAIGEDRLAVDQDVQMVLVAARGGRIDDATKEIDGCGWAHPSEDADGFSLLARPGARAVTNGRRRTSLQGRLRGRKDRRAGAPWDQRFSFLLPGDGADRRAA